MYAMYHVVVVGRFAQGVQAGLTGVGLTVMGRILVMVREKNGVVAAALLHSGLDIGLMVVWLYLLLIVS